MSNDAGGPPGHHPPNMNGQERPLQPIGGSRSQQRPPPPNNVSGQQQQGVEHPPPNAMEVWNEVSEGLDRNATVVWSKAVESLEAARRHLEPPSVSPDARSFVDARMMTIISILLEQNPNKIGAMEKDCVEKSVKIALAIVKGDLEAIVNADAEIAPGNENELQPCLSIATLNHIFYKKKMYYKASRNWSNQNNTPSEVRNQMVSTFKRMRGLYFLGLFMERRAVLPKELQLAQQMPVQPNQQGPQPQPVPLFPPLDIVHTILEAVLDSIHPNPNEREADESSSAQSSTQEDVLRIANAVKKHLLSLDEDTLKKLQPDAVKNTMYRLQRIYERLSSSHPPFLYEYYEFSRTLVLKLITSTSLPLKLMGWTALEEIIEASIDRRPPPKAYIVEGAGLNFINGRFEFDPSRVIQGGWAKSGAEVQYVRKIPENNGNPASNSEDGAGKTLTLFRCTMRSQQKWWFISEADADQPGTDKDIDYYQHKSKPSEDMLPSASGWVTCRSGSDPSPTLRPVGLMVPPGEEENTLECVLAKWAIDNKVIELVLGDSIHREIVARSTALIKFLASMCENSDGNSNSSVENDAGVGDAAIASPMQTENAPNPYCLQLSHLILAWKTCTSKTDAAVSAEIYNLLVSILPSLPDNLAIPLLQAIRSEVNKGNHNFFEVSEFCCAIATISENCYKNNNPVNFNQRVREEILGLQWAILSHEDAPTLKSYQNIKRYVAHEIGQRDSVASMMRGKYLLDCREWLTKYSQGKASAVNEVHALHMVQLSRFVFESYPTQTTNGVLEVVADHMSSLADLLLIELMAYLNRGRSAITAPPVRKPSSASVALPDFNFSKALSDRLQILRSVYGLSPGTNMTFQQVEHLWSLCALPIDREAIMDFLAELSNTDAGSDKGQQMANDNRFQRVLDGNVCVQIFENLFCSPNVGWECLGEVAFGSFQTMYKNLSQHGQSITPATNDCAIDALWKICLTAGNENVATSSRNELLNMYIHNQTGEQDGTQSGDSFSKRIFNCLCQVKEDLQRGGTSSLRAAERCIKILKNAFDISTLGGGVNAVAERLRLLFSSAEKSDLNAYLNQIPHGLRGVSSCITVPVMAKKAGEGSDRFTMDIHLLQSVESIKMQVAKRCNHDAKMIKLQRPSQRNNPNSVPDTAIAADLGISEMNELIFVLNSNVVEPCTSPPPTNTVPNGALDLSGLLDDEGAGNSFGVFFDTLISVLESLPASNTTESSDDSSPKMQAHDSHSLVWDVLLAMPSNARVCDFVQQAAVEWKARESNNSSDAMIIDSAWSSLVDISHFERSVYVLQVLDFSLRPPPYLFSCIPFEAAQVLSDKMRDKAHQFQSDFIRSGGFEAVLRLFVESGTAEKKTRRRMRMANEFSLRILSTCFFGDVSSGSSEGVKITEAGLALMKTFPNIGDFLKSLMYIVVDDEGVADAAILRVLRLIEALLKSDEVFANGFTELPTGVTEKFLTSLLLWEGSLSSVKHAAKIRKKTEDMILETPLLCSSALPFLVEAMKNIDSLSDGSNEFFSVMMKIVAAAKSQPRNESLDREMEDLGTAVCDKLAMYPRPTGENEHIDYSTGVLCGCLNLLLSLIDLMGGNYLRKASRHLMDKLGNDPWWKEPRKNSETVALVNLMGTIFDCFVSSSQLPGSPPICSDKKSRQLAFRVVLAAAQACNNGEGYQILVCKIQSIMSHVTPSLRHRWALSIAREDGNSQRNSNTTKYSGLKNQGCTCYMNSFLQQLFMMPTLRNILCSAELPSSLRSSGGGVMSEGRELVGKRISLHWDCGNNYDALVDAFDENTGMHTITYLPIQLSSQHQQQPPDLSQLPEELPEQFILREGRPNRETGAFELIRSSRPDVENDSTAANGSITESEDEASSRKLLEEVQRTFVNLDEARGRCYDPRSLVEASNCLKLEFDVWQQNDAAEFAMKLLDRLEISLKRWSPSVFKYLAHTFGLKTTKQKICKECGLKTSREENLMNIDCQIRNKSSIHEALSTLCEDEIMEGDNKVLCDRCKVKTNTVLRTAISTLPDVLILSLKRFDLDYTTFETVKLNSRCEFEEALNMKQYTLEAKELLEAAVTEDPKSDTGSMMDLEDEGSQDPLSKLADDDYEYKLVGVLVHAGVAQGGHYYSFIKDRTSNKWYRFDDEDVTPFDPSLIEQECFGGKVKKETKFPNGHVHTVENEQFANALMLLYEKVKPTKMSETEATKKEKAKVPMDEEVDAKSPPLSLANGYDSFLPSVKKSNSTHSWQSFLLTSEFQSFMGDILSHSISGIRESSDVMDDGAVAYPQIERGSWRFDVVQLSLSFLFDLLFHLSLDNHIRERWSAKVIQIFTTYPLITEAFVSSLAERTRLICENWIRAYTVECSDEPARRTALHIFASAVKKQVAKNTEQNLLKEWTLGWEAEWAYRMDQIHSGNQNITPMQADFVSDPRVRSLEDISKIGTTATGVGIILSFISLLLDLTPRTVQTRVELSYFIELLVRGDGPEGRLLRAAMSHAQFPIRLVCLAWRDKLHHTMPRYDTLRSLFPGACLASNLAIGICKHESQTILQIGMNNGAGNQFAPHSYEMRMCLEAFACLIGVPYSISKDITYETGEIVRGRNVVRLTPLAVKALTIIYEDSKTTSSKGMTKREIQNHIKRCDIREIPPQRLDQIMNKHAVIDEKDGTKVLPFDGFLDIYQTYACQSNANDILRELQFFGFRPDLSRMSQPARWVTNENGDRHYYTAHEMIATDVTLNRTWLSKHRPLVDVGVWNPQFLYFTMELNNIMAQYIHVAIAVGHHSESMILALLRMFHDHRYQWNSDANHVCRTGLCLLAAIPDDKQQDRINTIMLHNRPDEGDGILIQAHQCAEDQHEGFEKCAHFLHEIRRQRAVAKWMDQHQSHWAWMELENGPEMMNPQQSRGDHSGRRGGNRQLNMSDDDDYDDDDDDPYGFDPRENMHEEMIVSGCGIADINGLYKKIGHCDEVPKYSKMGRWEGNEVDFLLFRCKLSDNTRRWYISIVPGNIHPGTTKDIDFYYATAHGSSSSFLSPDAQWNIIPQRGVHPPPRVAPAPTADNNQERGDYI